MCFGTDLRIVDDDGKELPRDGKAVGHFARERALGGVGLHEAERRSRQGRLADYGRHGCDRPAWTRHADRPLKDVIKSGGEWISSIQLEDCALSHPEVLQAAVIAINHEKWQERPLLLVVRKQGSTLDGKTLLEHMRPRIASWWMPDAVEFWTNSR